MFNKLYFESQSLNPLIATSRRADADAVAWKGAFRRSLEKFSAVAAAAAAVEVEQQQSSRVAAE